MKKKTISALLTALNIVLVIAIIVLIVKISTRKPMTEADNQVGTDIPTVSMDVVSEVLQQPENVVENTAVSRTLMAIPQSTTSVNVRSGPGTDYDRIGSAYTDCEYEVIAIYNSGWTKLNYDGTEGYISNDFLCFKYRDELSDGNYTYTDVPYSELDIETQTDVPPLPVREEEPDNSDDAATATDDISENTDTTAE